MIHQLKIKKEYFKDVMSGRKKFEVRKNDRQFKRGDLLAFNEIGDDGKETDNVAIVKVIYLLDSPDYCKKGYVIMGMSDVMFKEIRPQ